MTADDRVADALERMAGFYPNATITAEQLADYADDLADLPAEAVVQAVRECYRTLKFFPSLAEIRQRVTEVLGDGTLVDAETAWGEVRREALRVGYNRPPVFVNGELRPPAQPQFSSPFIAQAVEDIGWRDICLTDDEDIPTVRAQFRKALDARQRRAKDRVVSGRAPIGPALESGNGNGTGDLTAIGDAVTLREGE